MGKAAKGSRKMTAFFQPIAKPHAVVMSPEPESLVPLLEEEVSVEAIDIRKKISTSFLFDFYHSICQRKLCV